MRCPVVILCGGRGTRMSELTRSTPKPMVIIGNRPILWHIIERFAWYGHTDFYLALGWMDHVVRSFVVNWPAMMTDFSVDAEAGLVFADDCPAHLRHVRIHCVDTGLRANTGTRVRRILRAVPDQRIIVTYGDGLGDVDFDRLLDFHRDHGRLATVTVVQPPGRFGQIGMGADNRVHEMVEKPEHEHRWVNGGFMVFERTALVEYLPLDADVMLEHEPLRALAAAGELMGYRHEGFWRAMDTPVDHAVLEELWLSGESPWVVTGEQSPVVAQGHTRGNASPGA
jgi:glucose-1-phosphate cytidylyltransferase